MGLKSYFTSLNIDIEKEMVRSDISKKYRKLLEIVKESELEEGAITSVDTKDYLSFKIMNLVSQQDDTLLETSYEEIANSIDLAIKKLHEEPLTEQPKFLENDLSIHNFKDMEDVEEYLSFREKYDIWVEPYVFELKVIGVERGVGDMTSLIAARFNENINKNSLPSCDDEKVNEASKDNGLLVAIPVNGKYEIYPLRYTGLTDLYERSGTNCRCIRMDEEKGLISLLPTSEKAQWITRGCSLNSEHSKILIRDGKIANAKSNKYAVLEAKKGNTALIKAMAQNWPSYEFYNGMVSHEYLLIDYYVNDEAMESSFKLALENVGVSINGDIKAGIRYTTSDVGTSCMTATPFVMINGSFVRLGNPLKVEHIGKNKIETFEEQLPQLAASLQEAEDIIEELGNTKIDNVVGCIQHISLSERGSTLPVKATKQLIKKMILGGDYSGTAIDVYLALNEIIEIQNNIKKQSPSQLINLTEEIAKFMFIDYTEYDLVYDPEQSN